MAVCALQNVICQVYATLKVAYTSVTFEKAPEQHGHVYLVGLYRNIFYTFSVERISLYIRVVQLFPWNIPWPMAKESLSDVGFENIFVFNSVYPPIENL